MKKLPQIMFFLMAIACAGAVGAWIGQGSISLQHQGEYSDDTYALLHGELNITDAQESQIAEIEKEFTRLRTLYEDQMRAANLELAQAIKDGGYRSPNIEPIVHRIHESMGSLQTLSLKHLADIESVLEDEQNTRLREMVIERLQHNAEQ